VIQNKTREEEERGFRMDGRSEGKKNEMCDALYLLYDC
jgi:hypothetical protein